MKPRLKILERILTEIRNSKTVCIVGHVRPDGDCIGSQLGLAQALLNEGKNVVCWNEDAIPQKLSFLDPGHLMTKPKRDQSFDCVISLDSASLERIGKTVNYIQTRRIFINIDHHQSNTRFGDVNWVSSLEPSTGELVFRLMKSAGWPVTESIADCLFTAVSTDTGSFQYSTTRPNTYYVAGDLVERGANLARICDEVYQSYPLSRVRLLQHVFNHFKLTCKDQLGYFWLRPADFERTGSDPNDSEGLIDHIRAIEPVVVACLFEEVGPELVRVSLRSKSDQINVNAVLREFGGGGHPAAAGARIVGKPMSVQRRVLAAIKKAIASAKL
jgi:bifunctional oligoribonuclease and PAP phosphatase NrnA